jgi:hypothetical protein
MARKPWSKAAWRGKRQELLDEKCVICGSIEKPLVLHHLNEQSRNADEFRVYLSLDKSDIVTLCKACHYAWHKTGKLWCPNCGKRRRLPQFALCYACRNQRLIL